MVLIQFLLKYLNEIENESLLIKYQIDFLI